MKEFDTRSVGGASAFPSTRWSMIHRMKQGTRAYRDAIDQFLRSYWTPVYKYIRVVWNKDNEDAKDLTQEFLMHVMKRDLVPQADQNRGSLRSLLKTALRHFLSDVQKGQHRRKRSAGAPLLSVHGLPDEDQPSYESAERAFDMEWAGLLMEHAVTRVREELLAAGKEAYFKAFESIDLTKTTPKGYREVAAELGVKESDVRNYLTYARSILKRALLQEIADYSGSEPKVLEEFRDLFGRRT